MHKLKNNLLEKLMKENFYKLACALANLVREFFFFFSFFLFSFHVSVFREVYLNRPQLEIIF